MQSGKERVEVDVQSAAAHTHGCLQDMAEALQGGVACQDLLAPSPAPPHPTWLRASQQDTTLGLEQGGSGARKGAL